MTTTLPRSTSVDASARPCAPGDLTEDVRSRLLEVVSRHRGRSDELIQVLHEAQSILGWLPHEMLATIATEMGLPYSRVRGVVTFYSLFTTEPRGRHTINVCLGTACYVRGGRDVLAKIGETLGVEEHQTTPDRRFSLAVVRCVGACGLAPVVTVDDDVHKRVNPNRIGDVVEAYE